MKGESSKSKGELSVRARLKAKGDLETSSLELYSLYVNFARHPHVAVEVKGER